MEENTEKHREKKQIAWRQESGDGDKFLAAGVPPGHEHHVRALLHVVVPWLRTNGVKTFGSIKVG